MATNTQTMPVDTVETKVREEKRQEEDKASNQTNSTIDQNKGEKTSKPQNSLEVDNTQPIIRIEKLNVTYAIGRTNKIHVLKDIDLEIYPGEFIIFFGPSGCGKSTLLYSIAGLETNIEGKIYFHGKSLSDMTPREIEHYHQRKMGMIFQAYYLINSLTVFDNVILPQMSIGAKHSDRTKRAIDLLKHFGVWDQANKLPNELSGGQQQRVAICRALINDPELLLADEPVGNLDSKSAQDVMNLLNDLNHNAGKTIILVTHNPEHLHFAHRVFYIRDGRIIKTEVNQQVSAEPQVKEEEVAAKIPKSLELLARTFSSIAAHQTGNLLTPFKAKQIVLEVLTGLTAEELEKIQKKVEEQLLMRFADTAAVRRFLDEDAKRGGMGFDRRKAERLAAEIMRIIQEVKLLERQEERLKDSRFKSLDQDSEVVQIRQYLLETFGVKIHDVLALIRMNQAIKDRLENKIDKAVVQKVFDMPIKRGGVGIDKRLAQKMAKRLELLILAKYK